MKAIEYSHACNIMYRLAGTEHDVHYVHNVHDVRSGNWLALPSKINVVYVVYVVYVVSDAGSAYIVYK